MFEGLKEQVCQANKELVKHGLAILTWGNVSAIDPERQVVAIKPSGVPYEELIPSDIVLLDLEGRVIEGGRRPSSDTPTHLELYRAFPDVRAIVHTHSPYATVFAQAKRPIHCMGTTHADHFRGTVPVTRDLEEHEVRSEYEANTGKAITERFAREGLNPMHMPACLVASHGPFVWGPSVQAALENAVILELVARMKLDTLRLNPAAEPIARYLLEKHHDRKHGPDAYYGQKKE